jgi:hypothetical protein
MSKFVAGVRYDKPLMDGDTLVYLSEDGDGGVDVYLMDNTGTGRAVCGITADGRLARYEVGHLRGTCLGLQVNKDGRIRKAVDF